MKEIPLVCLIYPLTHQQETINTLLWSPLYSVEKQPRSGKSQLAGSRRGICRHIEQRPGGGGSERRPATVGGEWQEQDDWKKYHLKPSSDYRGFIIPPDFENGSHSDALPRTLRHSHKEGVCLCVCVVVVVCGGSCSPLSFIRKRVQKDERRQWRGEDGGVWFCDK